MKITLSLWDIGGQARFEFFKTDFFKGTAVIGVVFDLSRPDTFERVDTYFEEIRERSGNIPIILVGNKNDLKKEIGETIPREKIIQEVNQFNLFEYIETSALNHANVDKLFNRLAITALLDFRPRLGEIINSNHFRFKVLLIGAAAVGKSSLIRTFVKKEFDQDYKLTIGLDFMVQNFEIPSEDLPKEIHDIVKEAVLKSKKKIKISRRKAKITSKKNGIEEMDVVNVQAEETIDKRSSIEKKKKSIFSNKYIYLSLAFICIVSILIVLTLFIQ